MQTLGRVNANSSRQPGTKRIRVMTEFLERSSSNYYVLTLLFLTAVLFNKYMQRVANQDAGAPMTKVAGNSSDNSCISISTDTFYQKEIQSWGKQP